MPSNKANRENTSNRARWGGDSSVPAPKTSEPVASEAEITEEEERRREEFKKEVGPLFVLIIEKEDKRAGFPLAQQLYQKYVAAGWPYGQAFGLLCMGYSAEDHGEKERYALAALEIAEPMNIYGVILPALNVLGGIGFETMSPKAEYYYLKAIRIAESMENWERMLPLYSNISGYYLQMGDEAAGITYATKGIELYHAKFEGERSLFYAHLLTRLASTFRKRKDYEASLKYFQAAADHVAEWSPLRAAYFRGSMSGVYISMGDLTKAREFVDRAAAVVFENPGADYTYQLRMHISLADVAEEEGKYEEALRTYEFVFKEAERTGDEKSKYDAQMGMIHVEFDQGNTAQALQKVEVCIRFCEQHRNSEMLIDALETQAKCLGQSGDWNAAYQVLNRAKHEAELKALQTGESRLRSLQVIHEFNEERKARLESEHTREMVKLELQHSQRELGNTTLQLLAQTELLSDLRADLLQIARKISPQDAVAREIRERVKNLPCQSIDWKKFDAQFKAAHPDFVHQLMAAVPDISPMEIRISTLIRMNLKSEEIARLFCVTERAVEFHRLNIRKKMGLKTKDNLSLVLAKM